MGKRKAVNIPGFKHVNPIPNAAMIGNTLMSGLITGVDAEHKLPPNLKQQCVNMFGHVRSIVEAGGLSMDDIIKISVWLKDPTNRVALNEIWLETFPDAETRPARQTMAAVGTGEALILCDILAIRS